MIKVIQFSGISFYDIQNKIEDWYNSNFVIPETINTYKDNDDIYQCSITYTNIDVELEAVNE